MGSTERAGTHGDTAGGPTGDGDGTHADDGHEHNSRWPTLTAFAAAALYAGIGLVFVGLDLVPLPLAAGLAAVGALGFVVGIAGWVREAFGTGTDPGGAGNAGPVDRRSLYWGTTVLFLVSDVATFLGGFIYYAFIRAGAWPPAELPPLLGSLVAINTVLLLVSSVTLHYGHEALHGGNRRRFLGLLGLTTALGAIFVGGQALEYYEFVAEEGFTLASGAFGSAFYGLTGLHGLHVAAGVVMLATVFVRALRGAYGPERDAGIRTVSLYWHFVDAVWIFLVLVLYVGAAAL
ncbi:cytochrome c oxidase subunit 3 [Haloglomus litoreum]|uniref:cytochrome c oxidase subunit 3 n=1 Tax=Haloglomus litoreum TaxID=3034026 RepID=UPI0023E7B5E3|nr:heme-copper oxidase subunit III [Haloglomus sp. DT116]